MKSCTISIFDNKIFFDILAELKLFSEFKIRHYEDFNLCLKEAKNNGNLIVFFDNKQKQIIANEFPTILITNSLESKNRSLSELNTILRKPFSIFDFKKKIILLHSRNEFKKNSLIYLSNYILDKNERKIKKDNLEIQLSEKEINFLILFSKSKEPISKNLVLKKVWNYSSKTETHTVETHIHRLRKKILEKFGDKKFIKNNEKGYYI